MTLTQARARRAEIAAELRSIHETANGGALDAGAQARWTTLEAEALTIAAAENRAAALDELDRRAAGAPVTGTGDSRFDAAIEGVGLLDAIRAGMGGTDHAAGRAREVSQELERRSGRKAQGILWSMRVPAEQRTLTTTTPVGGPGSAIIGQDYRPDLFIDRLRNATKVRALGATVLSGLSGNVTIPRRKSSMLSGWAAENTALSGSDPQFDGVTLSPKHAGVLTEFSRNMILQASPDVEALARQDMALVLAETLDAAAIAGTGANAQPLGILNTAGIGSVALGANGGPITFDALADLVGTVDDANANGTGFLTNTKVRRAAAKVKTTYGEPLGLDVMFQGQRAEFSNIVPSTGTKGTGTGLSSVVYGNWSDLLIGMWAELDVLTNPYEATAYPKGNVSVRAFLTCDIALRHAASFAAITDVAA